MRKFLSILALLLSVQMAQAQCSSAVAGRLSGNMQPIGIADNGTVPAPVFTTNPSGLPNTEFLVTNPDEDATDGGGAAIIYVDTDGTFPVMDLGLGSCGRFAVTPVSYDIHQLRRLVQAILNDNYTNVPVTVTCCQFVGNQFQGFCDSLNAAGINDSTDINNISDFFTLVEVIAGPGSTISIGGAQTTLGLLNNALSFLGPCAGGVTELCFVADTTGQDRYMIMGPAANGLNINPANALIVGSSGTQQFTADFMPMGSCPQPLSWSIVGSSANVSIDAMTGLATATGYDTVQIAVISFQDTMLRDTATLIVRAQQVGVENINAASFQLRAQPNPFADVLVLNVDNALVANTANVQIVDIAGKIVFSQIIQLQQGNHNYQLATNQIPNGFYTLRLISEEGQAVQKIIKQ